MGRQAPGLGLPVPCRPAPPSGSFTSNHWLLPRVSASPGVLTGFCVRCRCHLTLSAQDGALQWRAVQCLPMRQFVSRVYHAANDFYTAVFCTYM